MIASRKPFSQIDKDEMARCAERLKAEPDPEKRLDIQIRFVREMEKVHGHDRATRMLTEVWKLVKLGKDRYEVSRRKDKGQ